MDGYFSERLSLKKQKGLKSNDMITTEGPWFKKIREKTEGVSPEGEVQ